MHLFHQLPELSELPEVLAQMLWLIVVVAVVNEQILALEGCRSGCLDLLVILWMLLAGRLRTGDD